MVGAGARYETSIRQPEVLADGDAPLATLFFEPFFGIFNKFSG